MRTAKLFFGILFLSLMSFSTLASNPFSSSSATPATTKDGVPIASKKQQQLALMKYFVNLSAREYGNMRGKKLNFFERLSFKAAQHRMKQQLKAAGSSESEGVNWAGFALGAVLGLLGVLGAYIFSDDKNLIKWTWIGCGIWIVLALIFII